MPTRHHRLHFEGLKRHGSEMSLHTARRVNEIRSRQAASAWFRCTGRYAAIRHAGAGVAPP